MVYSTFYLIGSSILVSSVSKNSKRNEIKLHTQNRRGHFTRLRAHIPIRNVRTKYTYQLHQNALYDSLGTLLEKTCCVSDL